MDSYLELSPDSSAPQTPSPPSSFDLDEMNNSPQSFHDPAPSKLHQDAQDPNRIIDTYPYDNEEGIDNSHQFWSNQPDPLAVPQRGPYLSQLYDNRMKLEVSGPSDTQREHPSIWSQTQAPDHMTDPNHYYRRASYPHVRNDHPEQMSQHPSYIPQEPGSFLGPYSSRSDAFYGEPMAMGDHVCFLLLKKSYILISIFLPYFSFHSQPILLLYTVIIWRNIIYHLLLRLPIPLSTNLTLSIVPTLPRLLYLHKPLIIAPVRPLLSIHRT